MSSQLLKRSLQIVEEKPTKLNTKKKKSEIKKSKDRQSHNNRVEDNIKKLMALSKPLSSEKDPKKKRPDFEKMFHNARPGTRAKKQQFEEQARREAEPKSVFTKEDFLKFERELFCDK